MGRLSRSERLVAMTKYLADRPHSIVTLSRFMELFGAAKSTASEDVAILRETFDNLDLGKIETISGAAGGVKFIPFLAEEEISRVSKWLAGELSSPTRLLPGGFIYMTDILFSPRHVWKAALIFATRFCSLSPDCVLTVETKGIPLAFMTAWALNVPLSIARRNAQVTEGPLVTINYVSGSARRVETMSIARRAIPEGSSVLIIDDFMKGGGTAHGMVGLVREVGAEVAGIGVLIETAEPREKLVNDYLSILVLEGLDEEAGRIFIRPTVERLS
ncbi:MAG TPA: pur operon repressor [Firmicutes bacterium]|nr:pur operon repressor [Bacillota bacterium]